MSQVVPRYVNPETGRLVQYGSAKWDELIKRGLISASSTPITDFAFPAGSYLPDRKVPVPVNPFSSQRYLQPSSSSFSTQEQVYANQQALAQHYANLPPHLQQRAMTYSDSPQGSATRGWALAKPKRGSERRDMLKRCGSQAFLLPDQLKFPIMDVDCRLNCKGVQSAYNLARKWKYDSVAAEANAILRAQCGRKQ